MRSRSRIGLEAVFLAWLASCAQAPAGRAANELLCCGAGEVFILDVSDPATPRKVWGWMAADRADLPEPLRKQFGSTDECKPVEGGAKILVTSSGGGVALVERASGRVLFHASVRNAHSAELLPRGRVAVAGSTGEGGNRLVLFDLSESGKPLWHDGFPWAHGAVWDEARGLLWALGEKELRAYRLKDWETASPSLVRAETHPLPGDSGHELRPVPGAATLIVTANPGVWLFDRDRKTFAPHPVLGGLAGVKSVDIHPATGRTAYTKADTSWWTERVRFLGPAGEVVLPGERLYKVRWNSGIQGAP